MRKLLIALILLTACQKEELRRVELSVHCLNCAIEWMDNGTLKRDTLYGQTIYENGMNVDTVATWSAGYHITLKEWEAPWLKACHLSNDGGTITVKSTGDIDRVASGKENCISL